IDSGADVDASTGVFVTADDTVTLFTGAGSIGLALGGAGVGVAVNVDVLIRTTRAKIGAGADITTTTGPVEVKATAQEDLTNVAATFGASSSSTAVAFSVAVAYVETTTEALIESSLAGQTDINSGGDVTVEASSTLDMLFITGGGALAISGPGFGIAGSALVHIDNVKAIVGDYADIETKGPNGLKVRAYSYENMLDLVIAAAVSGSSVAVGGSVLVTGMEENTWAQIGSNVEIGAWNAGANNPGVEVTAEDTTEILSVAGAISVSSNGAVGAGVNVH